MSGQAGRPHVTVVGGGLAGLVVAIELARHRFAVTLYERRPHLGGLATTTRDREYTTNIGPRALYTNNPLHPWLLQHGLLPPLTGPRLVDLLSFRFVERSHVRRPVLTIPATLRRLGRTQPPAGPSFREWATPLIGGRPTERLIGLASLPLFHYDPGELSAASVHLALRNAFLDAKVTYVRRGWAELTDRLECEARSVGVEVQTGANITDVPDGRTVLAIPLHAARQLLRDSSLDWPSAATALLDIGLRRGHRAAAAFGLDSRVYAGRYTKWDEHLSPERHDLIQSQAGLRPGEPLDSAIDRIEGHLDLAFPNWRSTQTFRHRAIVKQGAGPADPPGSSWRDRPSIERGDGIYLVNDRVARPGLLSAVAIRAALDVAKELTNN